MKNCAKCHETKPLEDFPRCKRMTSGRASYCRKCCSALSAADYRKNRDKRQAKAKQWRQDHPEKVREYSRRSYKKISPEAWAVRKLASKQRQRVKRREIMRLKYANDPEFRAKQQANFAKFRAKKRRIAATDRRIKAAADLIDDLERFKTSVKITRKSHSLACPALKIDPEAYRLAQLAVKKACDARRDREKHRESVRSWKQRNRDLVREQCRRRRIRQKLETAQA